MTITKDNIHTLDNINWYKNAFDHLNGGITFLSPLFCQEVLPNIFETWEETNYFLYLLKCLILIVVLLGKTKQFLPRILTSYEEVTPQRTRKYFLSSDKFAQLYETGDDGTTVYKKMAEARKQHRKFGGMAPWGDQEERRGRYERLRLLDGTVINIWLYIYKNQPLKIK